MSLPINTTSLRFQSFCNNNDEPARPNTRETRSGRIPDNSNNTIMTSANDSRPSSSDGKLQCCCGRPECAYLENNNTILGGIERDLETAARLGQALLTRHESYISESQQEHERLASYINKLEKERTNLQTTNEKIVEENRQLLTQLEAANTSLRDSDSHVKSLETLLRDCELEVRRLNNLSRRTEELERKILELEDERITISRESYDAKEETRSIIKRWKDSEVKVRQLEHEVQRIEWDTKKDRERYEEIIARLERERVLERELGGAEGRLKGAAALRDIDSKGKGTNVVSHFVRDILQDNANLQAGVVELRDLLQTSNEEVQSLREQVLQHQPVEEGDDLSTSMPLSEQTGWSQSPPKLQQSVHVHHHYHAKLGKRERTPTLRRSSRKRAVIGSGMLPSTPESSAPTTPTVGPRRFVSSPILPASLHHPQPLRNRWSVQSTATSSSMASSFPSSPKSYFEQTNSIFDHLEAEEESSRPTSPESNGFVTSPLKFNSAFGFQDNFLDQLEEDTSPGVVGDASIGDETLTLDRQADTPKQEDALDSSSQELTPKPSQMLIPEDRIESQIQPEPPDSGTSHKQSQESTNTAMPVIIVEDESEQHSNLPIEASTDDVSNAPTTYEENEIVIRPSLRRTASHDSLVSISGMDIHIAQRPTTSKSQSSSFLKGNKAYFAMAPSAARRMPSTPALATVTEYTASSPMRSFSSNSASSPSAELSLPPRSVTSSIAALTDLANLPPSQNDDQRSSAGGFTRLVGGWVKGKWGIAPMKSSADLRSSAASASTSSSTESGAPAAFSFPGGRTPGINQKGSIAGFRPPQRTTTVQVKMVNEEGLKQSLAE